MTTRAQWTVDAETGIEYLIDIDTNKIIGKRVNGKMVDPEEKPKMLMWDMTLDVVLEFYERCEALGVNTPEGMNAVLLELAKEGKIRRVIETTRTPDQVAKDLAKNFGGKVLHIKGKKKK